MFQISAMKQLRAALVLAACLGLCASAKAKKKALARSEPVVTISSNLRRELMSRQSKLPTKPADFPADDLEAWKKMFVDNRSFSCLLYSID